MRQPQQRSTPADAAATPREASAAIDVLYEISSLLNTGLDRECLSLCVGLCETGVNPEALAMVVKELRRESAAAAAAGPASGRERPPPPTAPSSAHARPREFSSPA